MGHPNGSYQCKSDLETLRIGSFQRDLKENFTSESNVGHASFFLLVY